MKQIDFSNGKVGRNILQSSLPMLVAQMVSLLYSIVDRIFIGRIPGESDAALAGIGLCFPVIILITAFTNLYGLGGAPLCSIERGRGNRRKAQIVMNTAYFLLVVTSGVIFIAGELLARPMLQLFGASPATLPYAMAYIRIYLLGTLFSMLSTGLNPYISAQGYARTAMLTVTIGAVSNLILDPVFIFVFGMGVRGAALATILSQGLAAFFVYRFLRGSLVELRLVLPKLQEMRENLVLARGIIGLGTAPFVMQFTNSLVSVTANHMLSGTGGDIYVAVMTVVSSVRQIMDTPVLAAGEGTSPIISFNYGAGRPRLVRKAILILTAMTVSYTGVVWVLVELNPLPFIRLFSNEPAVLEAGISALHLYFFAFIFQALQISGQTTFKALNMKKHAIFFSLFRKVVLVVPLTLLLPTVCGLGTAGVFMAEPISNFVGGSACFITMLGTVMRRLKKEQLK